MYKIARQFRFSAAHFLVNHKGKCANMHGHNYRVIVEISASTLKSVGPQKNMVVDFEWLGDLVEPVLATLDHKVLNAVLPTDSPTAEYLTYYLWNEFQRLGGYPTRVTVWETDNCYAEYGV